MTEKAFHLDIGRYKGTIFSDGTIAEGSDGFGLNCLFLESDKHKILVECGSGKGLAPTGGLLVEGMAAEGINCADIDTIIITHGHGDHVAGCFDAKGQPIFPNAVYITSRKEWDFWMSPPEMSDFDKELFSTVRNQFLPLRERFELVEDEAEVRPDIKLLPAYGHTPGNVMVSISSLDKKLICIGDVIHSTREFVQPDLFTAFDITPAEALQTKDRVFGELAKSGVPVFAYHLEYPGLGYIRQEAGRFSWQPA